MVIQPLSVYSTPTFRPQRIFHYIYDCMGSNKHRETYKCNEKENKIVPAKKHR